MIAILFKKNNRGSIAQLQDYGPAPFAANINRLARINNNFRTALWTGEHLQVTLMCIKPREDIGLEVHPHLDQFIYIVEGQGVVRMGACKDNLDFKRSLSGGSAFVIPAGAWHNLVNTGSMPIKLFSVYAPPQHPHGTVHKTRADEAHD